MDCLTQIVDSGDIMQELCQITMEQFQDNTTISGVAQSVVDKIVRLHREQFEMMESGGGGGAVNGTATREDISLLVRNFGAKLKRKQSHGSSTTTTSNVDNNGMIGMSMVRKSEDTITTENTISTRDSSEIGAKSVRDLPMDENGRIKPYVDFSHFNQAWAKHKASLASSTK